jgi:hypothetical protein
MTRLIAPQSSATLHGVVFDILVVRPGEAQGKGCPARSQIHVPFLFETVYKVGHGAGWDAMDAAVLRLAMTGRSGASKMRLRADEGSRKTNGAFCGQLNRVLPRLTPV